MKTLAAKIASALVCWIFMAIAACAQSGPPVITQDLQSLTVTQGQTAIFSVAADGTQPLTYIWYRICSVGDPNYPECLCPTCPATATITFSNVQPSQAGDYYVVVSNAFGTTTSSTATLSVVTNQSYTIQLPDAGNYYLIANQLDHGSNTLNEILTNVPDGTQFQKWNCSIQDLDPTVSTFFASTGQWDIDQSLAPGEGAFIVPSGSTALTFTGTPHVPVLPISLPCGDGGSFILSRQTNDVGDFQSIAGFAPTEGTQLLRWNEPIQDFDVYTYFNGSWMPPLPTINVGEAVMLQVPGTTTNDQCISLSCPADTVMQSCTNVAVAYAATGTDLCYGNTNVEIDFYPPSGSLFPPGTTPVLCVVHSLGHAGYCHFNVTVQCPISIGAGLDLIANQLDHGSNTLNEVMAGVPEGSVLLKYDNAAGTWALSTYTAALGGWTPNDLTLNPGEGAFFQSPSNFSLLFTGTPHVPVLPVSIPNGACYLLSRQTNDIGNYVNIVGTPPVSGSRIFQWDSVASAYTVSVYSQRGGWLPGGTNGPTAAVGESMWISPLGPGPAALPAYYSLSLQPGLNLIANQLDHGSNTVAELLPAVPDGTAFLKYNNDSGTWDSATYSAALGGWTPTNLSLNPGEGAFLQSPVNFTLTFTGTPHVPVLPVAVPAGATYLLSRQTNDIGDYNSIVGLPPAEGDTVYKWTGSNYTTFTFTGGAWIPSAPSAAVGEALWISLAGGGPSALPPTIVEQPQSANALAGNQAYFSVSAGGTAPLAYQWLLGGNPINGATDSSYQTGPLSATDSGGYMVIVANSAGSVTSSPAMLTVLGATNAVSYDSFQFLADSCANLIPITQSVTQLTWWSGNIPLTIDVPPTAAMVGLGTQSCPAPSGITVQTPISEAVDMQIAPLPLPEAGSSLQCSWLGETTTATNSMLGDIILTNEGWGVQVEGTLFPQSVSSITVSLFSQGTLVGQYIFPGNDATLQITNNSSTPSVVRIAGDIAPISSGLTLEFDGINPVWINGESNACDAITFSSQEWPAGVIGLSGLALSPVQLSPLIFLCTGTRIGPLRIDPWQPNGYTITTLGRGALEQASSLAGPWTAISNAPNPYFFSTDVPVRFFRLDDYFLSCCRHPVTLINDGALPNATKVRISSDSPSTLLLYASASPPYLQHSGFPAYVEWSLPGGANFPEGNPIPGNFNIWVEGNSATDKHVLAQWFDSNNDLLCEQIVAVPCPLSQPAFDTSLSQTNLSPACTCVGTTITADPDSLDSTDPDVEAILGTPARVGNRTFTIPDLSVIDPVNGAVTKSWTVTQEDGDGDDLQITVPIQFDAQGNATITLPEDGNYSAILDVTANPCSTNSEADSDFDEVYMKVQSFNANFSYEQSNCAPNIITFADTSQPEPGFTIQSVMWTILDPNTGVALVPSASGTPYTYTFVNPHYGLPYTVTETVTETDGNGNKYQDTTQYNQVIFSDALNPLFTTGYSGCNPSSTYSVGFTNLTSPSCSNISYIWHFGDNSPNSTAVSPTHKYREGDYTVTLTATLGAQTVTDTQTVHVHPYSFAGQTVSATPCPDGDVVLSCSVPNAYWNFPGGQEVGCVFGPCDYARRQYADQRVRVCYPPGTTNEVQLYATDSNTATSCPTNLTFVTEDNGCCKRATVKNTYPFSYGGNSYQLYATFKVHGGLLHTVFARTKLKKLNSRGKWKKTHAYSITASYAGNIYFASAESDCDCDLEQAVSQSKIRHQAARAAVRHFELYSGINLRHFDVRTDSLMSTHTVYIGNTSSPAFTVSIPLSDGHCLSRDCNN